jgi:MFS family permease
VLALLITSWPGQKERSRALGTYGAVVSAGFASGAVLGGLLAEVTWRSGVVVVIGRILLSCRPCRENTSGSCSAS